MPAQLKCGTTAAAMPCGTQQQLALEQPVQQLPLQHRAAALGGAAGPSDRGSPAPGLSHEI